MGRLMVVIIIGENVNPMKSLSMAFIGMQLCLMIFAVFKTNIPVIFAVFIGHGFISSGVFPDILTWTELMTPVSGTLSCVFTVGYAAGDALITFVNGELFGSNAFSVAILPFAS